MKNIQKGDYTTNTTGGAILANLDDILKLVDIPQFWINLLVLYTITCAEKTWTLTQINK